MPFNFVSAADDRARFTATIPVDGKQLEFSVPLFTFMARDKADAFRTWAMKNVDQKLIDKGLHPVEEAFDFVVTLLDIDHAKDFVDKLVVGEKMQLWEEWNRLTALPLGESSGSANS